jgi:hypothetical protein
VTDHEDISAPGDRTLREEFDHLRSDVRRSGRVPDFEVMLSKAREETAARPPVALVTNDGPRNASGQHTGVARRRAVRIGGWMSLATAAAAVGILLVRQPEPSVNADAEFERLVASYSADAAGGAWRSPTATLLRSPGLDLGSVPSIGGALRDMNQDDEPVGPEGRDL